MNRVEVKAKIKINPTKRGYEVILEGINMKSPYKVPEELDGKEATVIKEDGKIVKIICEGKEYVPEDLTPKKESKTQQYQQNKQNSEIMATAKAPYNFVPLNHTIVEAENIPEFDKYHIDRHTGYIDFEIKTLTPLYIRNSDKNSEKQADFFNVDGKYMIPGSSIRGMIRTLVEIMSFGKFGYFNDERLYYRGLADVTNLRNEYQNRIRNGVKAGYLIYIKNERKFKIMPAEEIDGKTFEKFEDTSNEFYYEKQDDGSWRVWSGKFSNKKKNNWKIYPPDQNAKLIELKESDVKNYANDKNRNIPINILELAKVKKLKSDKKEIVFDKGVPVFYVEFKDVDGNTRLAFGHTRYFRLPYAKTIGDHIDQHLKDENKIDIAETIFGKESKWASRVFFEDSSLKDDPSNAFYETTSPKILSGPKPTTFQHYLKQTENANRNNLNHWNLTSNIRGNKLYWHRKTSHDSNETYSWNEGSIKKDTQHTTIRPIKEQKTFTGRIRFENLSEVELGALLFAMDLPENCAHKLGMGKPLGLGSVKIFIKNLFISDRENHYKKLFEGNNWFSPIKQSKTIDEFKNSFENYVMEKLDYLDKSKVTNLWDIPRMKELRKLLDWSNTNKSDWNEKTRYMEIEHKITDEDKPINEFKNRPVLPKPIDI
ncbi:MAG: hypothetical protein PWR20_1548 [Bacteroidales bacterium]|jgi:hypothetical protein|nr:hypothetical protein [Bacteroidales bacterium]MDN5330544.1 hypothetical protein [Bacteroidales bacterium]NPV36989.1 TIGR03986 family CRISPR-associated RAMP protein [Bacteroidales bacterium]